MIKKSIPSCGFLITVILLSGFLSSDISFGAQEDQMGVTVSHAPEPGWTPDQTNATSGRMVSLLLGGVVVILTAFGGFLVFKKVSISKGNPGEVSVQPATRPVSVLLPAEELASVPKESGSQVMLTPLESVQQPLLQINPVSVEPVRQPDPIIHSTPVSSPLEPAENPPVIQINPVLSEPVRPPESTAPHIPSPIVQSPVQTSLPDEDDLLFKHLDLLKQLKTKENV